MNLNHAAARRTFLCMSLLLPAVFVAGCGGGLGSSEADAISIDALTWSPSAPTSGVPVSAAATVSYAGSVSASGISYLWTQTSGPAVSLVNSTAATVYFTAPTVSSSTEVVLLLTVSANSVSASKSVTITVAP